MKSEEVRRLKEDLDQVRKDEDTTEWESWLPQDVVDSVMEQHLEDDEPA